MTLGTESHGHSLLVVRGRKRNWAVASDAVLGVENHRGWSGDAPLDVGSFLEWQRLVAGNVDTTPSVVSSESRVMVVDALDRHLPLLVQGTIGILRVPTESLLPLPTVFRRHAPWIASVALEGGALSIYVLMPQCLLEAWRG